MRMPRARRKRLRRCVAGRLVGVAGAQGGAGLPLAYGQGMASMFEPAGRVAQPPVPYEHRRAVPPRAGPTTSKPGQAPPQPRLAVSRQSATTSRKQKEPPPRKRSWLLHHQGISVLGTTCLKGPPLPAAQPPCGCGDIAHAMPPRRKAQGAPLRVSQPFRPAASRSTWALSVRSHENSGSSRPKCP